MLTDGIVRSLISVIVIDGIEYGSIIGSGNVE